MRSHTPTHAYILSSSEIRPVWVGLYVLTIGVQFICAMVRYLVASVLLWLVFTIAGEPTRVADDLAYLIAYGPLLISLATLLLPLGGWWFEQQQGGRSPSEREQLVLADAMAQLEVVDPKLRGPRRWFVVDDARPNAAVYADTLMVTRGLLEGAYLTAVLAHELGHLNSSDGRLTAALWRMTIPPRTTRPSRGLRTIFFFISGAAGVWLTRLPWAAYWRACEHRADAYAAALGQSEALAEFMEICALPYDLPTPYRWLTEASHPASEHRIDRLTRYEDEAQLGGQR